MIQDDFERLKVVISLFLRIPSDPLLKYEETIYIQHHDFPSNSILNGTEDTTTFISRSYHENYLL